MTRHVLHLVHRFSTGGLENVVLQLVNGLVSPHFKHTVVALTEIDPEFQARAAHANGQFLSLRKPPGQPFHLYPRFYRLLRDLRPDVVHTCNLAALEFMPVAWVARVPRRIHAEHGWDISDPQGLNPTHRRMRRLYARFVNRVVAVSPQIEQHLVDRVHIPPNKVQLVRNGVDVAHFRPAKEGEALPPGFPFDPSRHWVMGAVGRLDPIKNHTLLLDALAQWRSTQAAESESVRLVILGEGAMRGPLLKRVQELGLNDRVFLAGNRGDVAHWLRHFRCFLMPSIAEGMSCTLQEAMATGVPIIASDVGGNPEVLDGGRHGLLLPPSDSASWALAMSRCKAQGVDPASAVRALGQRGFAESQFGLARTLSAYRALFLE